MNFDHLKFVNEPMRTSSTTTAKPSINPDHAKLSMTKEQLKDLPQFKFAN